MQTVTILCDYREKKPLPFPTTIEVLDPRYPAHKLKTTRFMIKQVKKRLDAADYIIGDEPGSVFTTGMPGSPVVVERKYTLNELYDNLFREGTNRRNFDACLTNMKKFARPHLFVEGSLGRLYSSIENAPPGIVIDELQRQCFEKEITLLILEGNTQSQRALIADYIARLLINGTLTNATC